MFVDTVNLLVKAGDGGNGSLSFRHEKFIDKGGPDGGDGGKGGDVVVVAAHNQDTLAQYRYKKELSADDGQKGDKRKKHGKNGEDLILSVPVGTSVIANDEVLVDLVKDGQRAVIAKGGRGGYGNAHFVSSTRQAPKFAEKGEPGEELDVNLELKMIADIGLVGLPNAGKSTLLATVSNARPEIANYPFTTLSPNLGVVDIDNTSLLIADIPGLIEGASQGKGLGDEFLRHVERTAVLIHLVDAYNDDLAEAYKTIQRELKDYKVDISQKPQIVILSKVEGLDNDMTNAAIKELKKVVPAKTKVLAISAKSGIGVKELLREAVKQVERAKKISQTKKLAGLPILRITEKDQPWELSSTKKGYRVTGTKIERFARQTDFSNPNAVRRLRDIMRKMGIMKELERRGIEVGQAIYIGPSSDFLIEY